MRRIIWLVSGVLLTLLVGLTPSRARAGDGDFCWQATYGRGVGMVPEACPAGKERIGLLCYTQCRPGMKRFGFDCHSVCPQGMRDDGLFCRAAEYGRGAGYAAWDEGKCKREHKQGCEWSGAMVYPKCAPGYEPFGCCICRPKVPQCQALGLNPGIDLSCAKKVAIGDPTPGICGGGKVYDAGLCYPACQAGYNGVGPVCWGVCPKSHPVRCGMGCATSQDACAENTTDQVMSVLEAVANVGLAVATAGGSAAATTGAKAGMGMAKAGAKFAGNVSKSTVKATILKYGKAIGKEIAESAAETYAQAVIEAGTTGEFDPEILAGLDPTGIASIVVAYAKPVCTPPPANAPPPATRPTAPLDVREPARK